VVGGEEGTHVAGVAIYDVQLVSALARSIPWDRAMSVLVWGRCGRVGATPFPAGSG
jgi:hypothetical protein